MTIKTVALSTLPLRQGFTSNGGYFETCTPLDPTPVAGKTSVYRIDSGVAMLMDSATQVVAVSYKPVETV